MPFCVSQLDEQQGYKNIISCGHTVWMCVADLLWYIFGIHAKSRRGAEGRGGVGGVIGGYVGLYTKVGLWSIMSVVRGKIVGREIIMTVMTKIRLSGENSRDFNTANSSENIN